VRTQIANAMASGQRRKVQQNSTTTGKPHSVTIRKTKRLGQGVEETLRIEGRAIDSIVYV
jgi:hypothetical protein